MAERCQAFWSLLSAQGWLTEIDNDSHGSVSLVLRIDGVLLSLDVLVKLDIDTCMERGASTGNDLAPTVVDPVPAFPEEVDVGDKDGKAIHGHVPQRVSTLPSGRVRVLRWRSLTLFDPPCGVYDNAAQRSVLATVALGVHWNVPILVSRDRQVNRNPRAHEGSLWFLYNNLWIVLIIWRVRCIAPTNNMATCVTAHAIKRADGRHCALLLHVLLFSMLVAFVCLAIPVRGQLASQPISVRSGISEG